MAGRTAREYRAGPVAAGGKWLSAEDAATYLRLPLNTIYLLVNTGQLPALRFPVRIGREDLDGLVEQCRIKPGALSHLNQYAGGASRPGPPRINNSGVPDRRYGPRLRRTTTP